MAIGVIGGKVEDDRGRFRGDPGALGKAVYTDKLCDSDFGTLEVRYVERSEERKFMEPAAGAAAERGRGESTREGEDGKKKTEGGTHLEEFPLKAASILNLFFM